MSKINDWSDIAPGLIKVPITAYKHRYEIQKWWKKLEVALSLGHTNIVVTGRPTVGKSVLTSQLHGEASDIYWRIPDTSRDVETKAIQIGDWTRIIRVPPGQTSREKDMSLNEAFSNKNLEGVIHVVDWGFTQVRDTVITEQMIKKDKIDTIEKLRQFNMKSELRDFENICERIRISHNTSVGPKWLVIAVNKADLFMERISEAQMYYHTEIQSDFTDILNNLMDQIGKNNIKATSVPICSWDTDFEWNGEIIKSNIGGAGKRRCLRRNFIQKISTLSCA